MKKLIVIFLAIGFLAGCAMTKPQQIGKGSAELEPQLTAPEVSTILRAAIIDIEKLGCEPEFLSERGSYIWVLCYDKQEKPVMKIYYLQKLIDSYAKQKNESATTDK